MKKLLIALVLISSSVSAQEIFAISDSKSGGQIVLLSATGNCPKKQSSMFAADKDGLSWHGCWKMVGSFISVKYSDGKSYMYNGNGFILTDFYQKKFEPAKYQ